MSPTGLHPDVMPCSAKLTIPVTYRPKDQKLIQVAVTWNQPDNPQNARFRVSLSHGAPQPANSSLDPAGFNLSIGTTQYPFATGDWYLNIALEHPDSPGWQGMNLQTTVPKNAIGS